MKTIKKFNHVVAFVIMAAVGQKVERFFRRRGFRVSS